jgi:hypothetical protein
MLVNIDDEIIKLIRPLTVDKKEIEDSVNQILLTGLTYVTNCGFGSIKPEKIEELKRKYFYRGMLKVLNDK